MRILIIGGYLPPHAPPAAVRVSKLAGFLLARGHDVRLLGADRAYPPLIEPEFPRDRAIYAHYSDIRELPERLLQPLWTRHRGGDGNSAAEPAAAGRPAQRAGIVGRLKRWGRHAYDALFCIPDNYRLWIGRAVDAAEAEWRDWRPEVIFVTAPPHSGLIVAARLSRRWHIPWIAEYRDLWTEHPYYDEPAWRRTIDRLVEARLNRSVSGYVTVTASWADWLRRRGKPVTLAMNGFDPADYAAQPPARAPGGEDGLTILYGGAFYGRKRDPAPLFEALARLGDAARQVRVSIYSGDARQAMAAAERAGVAGQVALHGPIPRAEMLRLEQEADLLLLLRWDEPREDSVIAGKLFEYIGARRPILSVGRTEGEAADIIRRNSFGLVSNDPGEIAEFLRRALEIGAEAACGYDPRKADVFRRERQFETVESFLATAAEKPRERSGKSRLF